MNEIRFIGYALIYALIVLGLILISHPKAYAATTVYYQPTPYATSTTNGVHIWDGWITNIYYGQKFINDDGRLQVGGWGDTYRTYIKFDLEGLPSIVSTSTLWLMPYSRGDSSTPVSTDIYLVTGTWSPSMTWSTQPGNSYLGQKSAPTNGTWWDIGITNTYNQWRSGTTTNYGIMLSPTATNNKFNVFRSDQYSTDDGQRPFLELTFNAPVTVPDFKLPLPGNLSWLVTTEPGGWDCKVSPQDEAHTQKNYFSIDFSTANKDSNGNPEFGHDDNIPVIASTVGKITEIGTNINVPNGKYVVLDEDEDGDNGTGFTTRYLHLDSVSVALNDVVSQGDLLGYMGNTGSSTGKHVHFGTRYDDNGASTSTVQYATNEGLLLKSYQTECDPTATTTLIRYYPSTNTAY